MINLAVYNKDGKEMEPGDVVNALDELEDIKEQIYYSTKNQPSLK